MKKREALKQTAVEPPMGDINEIDEIDENDEIQKIMELILDRLADDDLQLSVADLMRLLELRRELAQSKPGSVTVGWIDACQLTRQE